MLLHFYCINSLATQTWCLARFLPLLIGDLIPEGDERWNNFLLLLQIMEYLFAPRITHDQVAYLELLIETFLEEFVCLYPDRPLTPKMHYLVHTPMWIRRYFFILSDAILDLHSHIY